MKCMTDLFVKIRLFIFIGIVVFHSCKSDKDKDVNSSTTFKPKISKTVVFPFKKLLGLKPVYKDSVYSIFITTISKHDKILFLATGKISDVQKESKFFMHVYPKDKSLLGENKSGNLNYDFKSNFKLFNHLGKDYYIAETSLPQIDIDKINFGQYGFRGNKSITWSVKPVLKSKSMQTLLDENGEFIPLIIDK